MPVACTRVISRSSTRTWCRPTDSADVNVVRETEVTPPGTPRFRYVTFVTLFSYTFVMYVLFTMTVLLTFTRSTYRGL